MEAVNIVSQDAKRLALYTIGLGAAVVLGYKVLRHPIGSFNAVDNFVSQHFFKGVKFLDKHAPIVTDMARKTQGLVNAYASWIKVPVAVGVAASMTNVLVDLGEMTGSKLVNITGLSGVLESRTPKLVKENWKKVLFMFAAYHITKFTCRRFLAVELTITQAIQWALLSFAVKEMYFDHYKQVAACLNSFRNSGDAAGGFSSGRGVTRLSSAQRSYQ